MVRLSALPEYEPPVDRWQPPPRRHPRWSPHWSAHGVPAWNEPGATREALWRLLTLLLESLGGRRPLSQLRATLATSVHEAMATRIRTATGHTHRLTSLHTCHVSPGVVELSASVRVWPTGRPDSWRVQALAGRMEMRDGQWLCTFLRPLTR